MVVKGGYRGSKQGYSHVMCLVIGFLGQGIYIWGLYFSKSGLDHSSGQKMVVKGGHWGQDMVKPCDMYIYRFFRTRN